MYSIKWEIYLLELVSIIISKESRWYRIIILNNERKNSKFWRSLLIYILRCNFFGSSFSIEVVIAPSALHIEGVKGALRADIAVAIQDIHTAKVCIVLFIKFA